MDVVKSLTGVALILVLASCSQEKSVDNVYSTQSAACNGQAVENRFIVEWENGRFTVEDSENVDSFKENFLRPNLAQVRHAERDIVVSIRSHQSPDAIAKANENVKEFATPMNPNWQITNIQADAVWAQNVKGAGITVGVVDSWVDVSHPQIASQVKINTGEIPNNGIDDDGNGLIDDYYGYDFSGQAAGTTHTAQHGTHVSGIILADSTKGTTGVKGIAPQAKLIPAPFIGENGDGSLGNALLAMQYAVDRGAKVINNSWGGCGVVDSFQAAYKKFSDQGVLLVVAAGNEGLDVDYNPIFPASYNFDSQITVAASTSDNFMTWWSNRGFKKVHVAAPGKDIYSTVPGGAKDMDGTSMASPVVAGAAALLWSYNTSLTATQIKEALIKSVDVISGHEFKVLSQGRINVAKGLAYLKSKGY